MNQSITEKSLAPYKKNISLITEKAESLSIKTVDQIEAASDILGSISDIGKQIKAKKEELTKPAQEIIKWARGVFGPLENECKSAERIIKDKMIIFDKKEEEKKLKKLASISKKVAEGKIDINKASDQVKDLEVQKSYSGESGTISFRKQKTIVITDVTKIPRAYLIPNEKLIREEVLAGKKVAGVELRVEKIAAKSKV